MAAPTRYRNASTGVVFPPTVSGGILSEDSTYYYRTFRSSGTFITSGPLSASVLVIAGGGGSGPHIPGGGGAGGYTATSTTISAGSYTVTIGAGGAAGYSTTNAQQGNTTSAFSISTIGGGYGGTRAINPASGGSGGSGGGGGGGGGGNPVGGGSGTAGQGNNGGSGYSYADGNSSGGGGGGAGSAGNAGAYGNGASGGAGLQWLNGTYYAGGGGGAGGISSAGAGGLGGGGNGTAFGSNLAAQPGVGGTGGGAGGGENGANGGSGVVIVRYAKDAATASNDTYELIGTIDLTGPQYALTFTGIPQQYKHLQIRMVTQVTGSSGNDLKLRFNADSTTGNYKDHGLYGFAGASATGSAYSGVVFTDSIYCGSVYPTSETNLFGGAVFDILDFANTSKNKTVRGISGKPRSPDGVVYFQSGVWLSTAAITSLTVTSASGTAFAPYSRISLYGLRA